MLRIFSNIIRFSALLFTLLMFSDCDPFWMTEPYNYALKPVYVQEYESKIVVQPKRDLNNPGKIYRYGNYLLINELNQGIHVIDNTDPANPENLAFIRILKNTDMAIQYGKLYVDYLGSITELTGIETWNNLNISGKISASDWPYGIPPPHRGIYYECIDPVQGVVIEWEYIEMSENFCLYE